MGKKKSTVHGVLVVDKAKGPTSHDVVSRARRGLGTRAVGHSGTLDPMATGVLVLAVGEATKLVNYFTGANKHYRATLSLGAETDTLDAQGEVTERCPVPTPLRVEEVRQHVEGFLGSHSQRVPAFSAVKIGGRRLHEMARRGEKVEAPERVVTLHRCAIVSLRAEKIEVDMEVSKGFYVRSFARDLGRAMGTRAHLSALRRTQSGAFSLDSALSSELLYAASEGEDGARQTLVDSLVPLEQACRVLPTLIMNAEGAQDAFHGRMLSAATLEPGAFEAVAEGKPVSLIDPEGRFAAIGERVGDRIRVKRGIRY